jgi:hypothetical protein
MTVPDVSSQIIFPRSALELASGKFAAKRRIDTLVFRLVSIEIASQCEALAAAIAAVWPGMGFVMAAYGQQSALKVLQKGHESILVKSARGESFTAVITLDKTTNLRI